MPSYTLNNWDGSLSKSHEHTSSQRQEKDSSASNTIFSRSTPIPAQKNEKPPINGNFILNKIGYDVEREGSAELVKDAPNGIPVSQEPADTGFLSNQQNGFHPLAIGTTPPLNDFLRAPESLQPTKLTFIPILESPLHANKTLTRRDASDLKPVQLFVPATTDSSPRNNESSFDEVETFSMHTMDADGEVEDDELIVEGILASYSPTKPQSSPKASNPFVTRPSRNSSPRAAPKSPLFTPPPSEEYIPVDRLFTPVSEMRKLVLSHVEVPPLRRPKSHYHRYGKKVQVHKNLQDAMQSAFSRNEDLGTLPSHPKTISTKKKPKESRGEIVNTVAGPSTLRPPSMVSTNKKRPRSHKEDNDFEGDRKEKKRSRTHIDIDLTLSGDEAVHQNVKPAPSAGVRYRARTDTLMLYLGVIHSVPISVLAHNTRFLTKSQPKNHGISSPTNAKANGTYPRRYFIPPKVSVQPHDSEDTISLGGSLTWEKDFHLPVDDNSDTGAAFVEDVSMVNGARKSRPSAKISHIPPPPSRPVPPKIDLAAEIRKKLNRKKQSDHVSPVRPPKATVQAPSATYVVATSSSSSTGLHENLQQNENENHLQRENGTNSTPSAKVLGKRRATTSDSPEASLSSNPASVNHGSSILNNQPDGLARNLDVFLHTYTRTPSPGPDPSSSSLVPYSTLQSVSPFYPSAGTTADHDAHLVNNSTMSTFYPRDLLVDVERSPEKFLSETVLDSLEAQSKPSDLWSALEDETTGEYAFSTIDPTLLGGQIMMNTDFPDPEPQFEPQPPSVNSEPSSPASQGSLGISKDEYEPSTTTTDFILPATNRAESRASFASSSSRSASAPFRSVSRRLHSQRKLLDMIPIDDLDIIDSSSSSSGYQSSSSSSDAGSESSVVESSRARVSPVKSKMQKTILPAASSWSTDWPLEERESYCHQCRHKTRLLKMICSCGKRFCARCITTRYPEGKYDYGQKQENNCPHCQGCCNCTICCKLRGDVYVSTARRPGPKKTMAMPPPALRERISLGGKTNLPPPSQLPSEPVKYWGAVYSLTGEKITSTFAPQRQEEGDPAVVYGLLNSGESEVVVKPKRKLMPRRVFIGVVQRHWGYSKHRRIKELKDKTYGVPEKVVVKSKNKHSRGETRWRWYVGHAARLFWPRQESTYCSLLDDLSPLSSLEDEEEEDEPDEPESLQQEEKQPRAASLGEDVVGQVIALALEACGTDSKVFPALV